MKKRIEKKQLARLWAATAHLEQYDLNREDVQPERYFTPARKPLSGKSARYLIGRHYRTLEGYGNGWLVMERPRFRADRRYIILAESEDDRPEVLRVALASDNA